MPTILYYSKLTDLLNSDALPSELNFFQGDLGTLLDDILLKEYQIESSPYGTATSYYLKLLVFKRLGIDIPGTGLALVLNPSFDPGHPTNATEIPMSVHIDRGVLGMINNFSLENFTWDADGFFDLIVQYSGVDEENFLHSAIQIFSNNQDPAELVNEINAQYSISLSVSLVGSYWEDITLIIDAIDDDSTLQNDGKGVYSVILDTYILNTGSLSEKLDKVNELFQSSFEGDTPVDYLKSRFIPKIAATLNVSAMLVLPRSIITPLMASGSTFVPDPVNDGGLLLSAGELTFDTEGGIGFDENLVATMTHPWFEIANSGFRFKFTSASIDLSDKSNIPQADLDGRESGFKGVFVESATVELPSAFVRNASPTIPGTSTTRKITGKNLIIGTGGFSGIIGLETGVSGMIPLKLGAIEIGISDIMMNFHMNKLISSSISAVLKIPYFKMNNGNDCIVGVEVFVKDQNNLSVSADLRANPYTINCFNIFDFTFNTVGVEIINGRKGIVMGGEMNFRDLSSSVPLLGNVLPKHISITRLIIWEDGSIDFEGSEIPLPSFNLEIGPVKVSITGLSYTSAKIYGRQYGIIGFNGMVDTGSGGFDGKANGVRLYFTTDAGAFDAFLRIESLKIDIKIPGNATREEANILIEGYLSVKNKGDAKNPENHPEYAGGVSFSMRNLGISGSAAMRMAPSVPSFIVDVGLEMSVPIPLAATGLGLYGVRGLIAGNYHVSKTAAGLQPEDSYWLYYKAKKPKEGITPDKFDGDNGFNLGGGVSLATMGDNGRSFSSKLFVMLGIPEIFLLQGQAAFLKQRCGLDPGEDPPFSAFLAVDPSSISAGIGANYQVPADGNSKGFVMDLQAQVQMAYFFGNASAWYINFGKDYPENERIRARLFNLIDAYAYLMLSSQGIKGGAGATFGFNKKIGPVRIGANAYVNVGGQLSFKPVQIGGYLDMGGEIYAKIYRFGFSLGLRAMLAAEAPRPYRIKGSFSLSIGLPWPFDDIDIDVDFEWRDPSRDAIDLTSMPLIKQENTSFPASAINMLTLEKFNVKLVPGLASEQTVPSSAELDNYVIPLDSYIDIEFASTPRLLLDGNSNIQIKGNTEAPQFMSLVPPQRGYSDQAVHTFEITQIKVKSLKDDRSGWVDYDIWGNVATAMDLKANDADTSPGKLPLTAVQLAALPNAYWQNVLPGSGKLNKLRIMAQDMFNYMGQSSPGSLNLEYFDFNGSKIFCQKTVVTNHIINWENKAPGFSYSLNKSHALDANTTIKSDSNYLEVVGYSGTSGFAHALKSKSKKGTEINFVKPLKSVSFKYDIGLILGDLTNYDPQFPYEIEQRWVIVRAIFYKRVPDGVDDNGMAKYTYTQIGYVQKIPQSITDKKVSFTYTASGNDSIAKVIITCDSVLSSTPTANGKISIGRQCFYTPTWDNRISPDTFKGTIGEVSIYGVKPNYITYSNPLDRLGTIAKWNLNNSVVNSQPGFPNTTKPYDDVSNAIDGTYGIIVGGLAASLKGAPTTAPLFGSGNYYTFNTANDAVEVPAANYYYMGFYGPVFYGWYYNTPYIPPIIYPESTFLYGVNATIKTNDQSNERRVIIDKRQNVWNVGAFGFTVYLLNRKLHIDICYGQVYTYSYDPLILTDGVEKRISFRFDSSTQKLSVWINGVKVCNDLVITELAKYQPINPIDLYLQEIQYQTKEEFEYSQVVPSQAGLTIEAQNIRDGLGKTIQPIWRPDTVYAIEVQGNHRINSNQTAATQKYSVLFRTRGPVGFFHEFKDNYPSTSETVKKQTEFAKQLTADEFKLAHLKHYIDTDFSSPDADGNLIYVKPIFRTNPKIKLYYLKPYLKAMFRTWAAIGATNAERRYSLRPVIIDPDTKAEVPFTQLWNLTQAGKNTANVDLWNSYSLEGFDCVNVIGQINKYSYQLEYTLNQVLKPNRLYDVNIIARFETPGGTPSPYYDVKVHTFSFQSSKYQTFAEQVQSFNLGSGLQAKYTINTPLNDVANTDPLKVLRVLIGITTSGIPAATATKVEELTKNYNTKFEAVTDNLITALRNLPPPSGTDVYIVNNQLNNKKVGILLRNPEAFIEPSLPDKFMYGDTTTTPSIQCFTASNAPVTVKYLVAKDGASVFIYNDGLDITNTAGLKIKINLYTYNAEQKTYLITTDSTIQL
jgi:hypothetical protein